MNSSTSIEYFRKQAKALCRSVAAGDAGALHRIQKYLKASDRRGLTKCKHVIAREHTFLSWDKLVRAEDIERQLAITMAREPTLNGSGIQIFDGYLKLPADEKARAFQDDRRYLRNRVGDVKRTFEWLLANLPPAKTLRRPVSSYVLKHFAEGDIGYISEGIFIAAALIARYPNRFSGGSGLDFGVSIRALKAIRARQDAAGTRSF